MSISSSAEFHQISVGVRAGERVRVDGDPRRLRALARAVEASDLNAAWFMGDEHGVPAYDAQRSDGTALFVSPQPQIVPNCGDDI